MDTASYTVMRRYLSDGYLPNKDSVRVEEYVNYFQQDYAPPTDPRVAFAFTYKARPRPLATKDTTCCGSACKATASPTTNARTPRWSL